MILDSGERREFETGAVRDMQEGKGRCDLMPLDILYKLTGDLTFYYIHKYNKTKDITYIQDFLFDFIGKAFEGIPEALLELSMHFEQGALKYGENNWQKGIPTNCYVDSLLRHYLKWKRGDNDERHDRAVLWNAVCLCYEVERCTTCN